MSGAARSGGTFVVACCMCASLRGVPTLTPAYVQACCPANSVKRSHRSTNSVSRSPRAIHVQGIVESSGLQVAA
eukprot:1467934-Alexandrium_andersonii.AAC.1